MVAIERDLWCVPTSFADHYNDDNEVDDKNKNKGEYCWYSPVLVRREWYTDIGRTPNVRRPGEIRGGADGQEKIIDK